MSGLEVIAVIGCVAAVVSAFQDGHAVVETIKAKRRERKACPPSKYLEESLARGPPAVEAEKQTGVERFGSAFAIGDQIATEALKDVLIDLQTSLLRHLRHAQEDDNMTDFSVLIDASDMGRVRAVRTLLDLHMRMLSAASIGYPLNRGISTHALASDLHTSLSQHSMHKIVSTSRNSQGASFSGRPILVNIGSNDFSSHVPTAILETTGKAGNTTIRPKHRFSISSYLSHTRLREGKTSKQKIFELPADNLPVFQNSQTNQRNDRRDLHSTASIPTDDDPVLVESRPASVPSPFEMPNPWAEAPMNQPEPIEDPILDRLLTVPTAQPSIQKIHEPSANNNYGGFCRGAFNLQVGSKNLRLLHDMGPVQSAGRYWGCSSKCAFAGTAYKSKDNNWTFDASIRSSHGVQFRWIFLAKSHVQQTRVKNNIYTYRCLFCVLQNIDAPVFQKVGSLMEHLSGHRGQGFGDAILHRTSCIDGRVASEEEEFDINLTPLEAGMHRLVPSILPSDEALVVSPAAISVSQVASIPHDFYRETNA